MLPVQMKRKVFIELADESVVAVFKSSTPNTLIECFEVRLNLRQWNNCLAQRGVDLVHYGRIARMWWNWQTRYFEVVVPQGVQVQVLPCAPFFSSSPLCFIPPCFPTFPHEFIC